MCEFIRNYNYNWAGIRSIRNVIQGRNVGGVGREPHGSKNVANSDEKVQTDQLIPSSFSSNLV